MQAIDNRCARNTLRVLNPQLARRLALANEATRYLRCRGWRVVEADLGRARPMLTIEHDGGSASDLQVTHLVHERKPSGVIVCRAFLLGCEVQLQHMPLQEPR